MTTHFHPSLSRALACALTTAAMLAGCGGGGGSTSSGAGSLDGGPGAAALQDFSARRAIAATSSRVGEMAAVADTPALQVVAVTKVGETRMSRAIYDYVFKVEVRNNLGSTSNVGSVRLLSVGAGATIIDGDAAMPAIAGTSSALLADTVTIRQDRTKAFDAAALSWSITVAPPPPAFRGKFIDKPVEGLAWQTATRSGFTDAAGEFGYDVPGETVWFSVGGLSLGSAAARPSIHVSDLSASPQEQWQSKNDRVAQLLQSVDETAGQGAAIRIPLVLRAPTNPLQPVDFTLPQSAFDNYLKSLLSGSGLPQQNFVPLAQASANAGAFKQATLEACPFEYPSYNPDSIGNIPAQYKIGNPVLTCQQRAAIHLYLQRVKPQIENDLNGQSEQLGIIESTFSAENVADAMDRNRVLQALNAIDESVGTFVELADDLGELDRAKFNERALKVAAAAGKIHAQVMTVISATYEVQTGLTKVQAAEANYRNAKFMEDLSSLFAEGSDCAIQLLMVKKKSARTAAIGRCVPALQSVIESFDSGNQLFRTVTSRPSDQALTDMLTVLADSLAAAAGLIDGADALRELGDPAKHDAALIDLARSMLGASSSAVKAASGVLKLAAVQQPDSMLNTGGGQFFIGVMDRSIAPMLEVASKCYGTTFPRPKKLLSLETVKAYMGERLNCVTTAGKVLSRQTAEAVMAVLGNAATIRQSGRQAELIVTQAVLEEYLWAGGDWAKVKARYGYGDQYSQWDVLRLVLAIGERKMGFNPVVTYLDVINIVAGAWNGANSFNALDASSGVLTYLEFMGNSRPLNLALPALELTAKNSPAGQPIFSVQFDPASLPAQSALVECQAQGALSPTRATPFREFFDTARSVDFEARFAVAGKKLVICSVYAIGGAFVGSKTLEVDLASVQVGQLVVKPAQPGTYTLVEFSFEQVLQEFAQVLVSIGETIRDVALKVVNGVSQSLTALFDTVGIKDLVAKFQDSEGVERATVRMALDVGQGPKVESMRPVGPVVAGQPATLLLLGTNLPKGLVVNIVDCGVAAELTEEGTDTQRKFVCTFPGFAEAGPKEIAIGPVGSAGTPFERAIAHGLTIDLVKSNVTLVNASPAPTPGASSVVTVTGTHLPSSAHVLVAEATCDRDSIGFRPDGTGFTQTCAFGSFPGTKRVTVMSAIDASGFIIDDSNSLTVSAPLTDLQFIERPDTGSGWNLRVTVTAGDATGNHGTFNFGNGQCTGTLTYEGKDAAGNYVFQENHLTGGCLKTCKIAIAPDTSHYNERCTGQGYNGTDISPVNRRWLDPRPTSSQLDALLPASAPTGALAASWTFNDCSGADSSGNRRHAQINGAPTCQPGRSGNALRFTGLDLPDGATPQWLELPINTSPSLTFSTWFKWEPTTKFNRNESIWAIGDTQTDTNYIGIWLFSHVQKLYVIGQSTSIVDVVPGQWTHVTVATDGLTSSLYINGNHVETFNMPQLVNLVDRRQFISSFERHGFPTLRHGFPGLIDDARLYSRVLSADEVRSVYLGQ